VVLAVDVGAGGYAVGVGVTAGAGVALGAAVCETPIDGLRSAARANETAIYRMRAGHSADRDRNLLRISGAYERLLRFAWQV